MSRCRACGEPGHNAARHKPWQPPRKLTSRSMQAATMCDETGCTFREAADRFGIAFQAVEQAWRRRFGDRPSAWQERVVSTKRRIIIGAVSGKSKREIAAETGASVAVVQNALSRRGIRARNPLAMTNDQIQTAAKAVADGASYQEAANLVGLAAARLAEKLRKSGVRSMRGTSVRDGRHARTLALVDAGKSVPEACAQTGAATAGIYAALKRQRRSA